jgi:hypothetical protein
MTHGIRNRQKISDPTWREYDQRRRFLLLDKLAMTAFVVALALGAAYEYWRALESMFAPLRAILAVH